MPPWLAVLLAAVVAAALLWIFAKVVKVLIWITIVLVLVGGLAFAVKLYVGA